MSTRPGRVLSTARYGEDYPRISDGDEPAPTVTAVGIGAGARAASEVALETSDRLSRDPETGRALDISDSAIGRQLYQFDPSVMARRFTLIELRQVCGFPADFALTGTYEQRWERLGRAVPPVMAAHVAHTVAARLFNRPEVPMPTEKPPYQVPSMADIRALPWNGLNAVSTFSGAGGSSVGYRMAGFRVLWASEFVPAAQDTYRVNMAPYTVLDTRDIRDVTPDDLLAGCGLGVGEIDLFDGSPPCASFSTAGKREAGWGKTKKYSDTQQRTDDLFYEFARLVRGCQPKVFVAENVSGLVKGTAKGYFIRIMGELRACGYQVKAKLLDAQWLGVPQARQRLILIGVRNDLGMQPVFPSPLPYRYTVRDALPHILAQGDNADSSTMRDAAVPSPTIGATTHTGNGRFPPSMVIDRVTTEGHGWFDGGDMNLEAPAPTVVASPNGAGWYNHEAHYRVVHDTFAKPGTNFAGGDVTDKPLPTVRTRSGDSYHIRGSQQAPSWVTQDPETGKDLAIRGQKNMLPDDLGPARLVRRFTLAELRRICGFPDDFILTGTYEQRWERLGRAVPPVMAAAFAAAVRDGILLRLAVRP